MTSVTGLLFVSCVSQPGTEWVSTTEDISWLVSSEVMSVKTKDKASEPDLTIDTTRTAQQIDGFGACFNELGWTSLGALSEENREKIMQELFVPEAGANLSICRIPVGANNFSLDWYSYNETPGDFGMEHFSIENDLETLVPYYQKSATI